MLIFATIFGVGFVTLVLSLIFGGDGDFDTHTDFDHDTGGHGPSIFSIKMVALLLVGFGAVGFGVRATTEWSMFQSSLAGIGGAIGVGIIGYFILRMFYASQVSSTFSDRDVLGQSGSLIDGISGSNYGQIALIIGGREITYLARSSDGSSIGRNTPVKVIGKAGNIVTVEAVN